MSSLLHCYDFYYLSIPYLLAGTVFLQLDWPNFFGLKMQFDFKTDSIFHSKHKM